MYSTINRTSHEKYTTYWGDGSGRDSYTIIGNAGLRKPDSYVYEAPRTGYQPKLAVPSTLFAGEVKAYRGAGKEPTAVRYFGDGTGRDSYVVKESGGMIPHYKNISPQRLLEASLRQTQTERKSSMERDAFGNTIKDWSRPWYGNSA